MSSLYRNYNILRDEENEETFTCSICEGIYTLRDYGLDHDDDPDQPLCLDCYSEMVNDTYERIRDIVIRKS